MMHQDSLEPAAIRFTLKLWGQSYVYTNNHACSDYAKIPDDKQFTVASFQ